MRYSLNNTGQIVPIKETYVTISSYDYTVKRGDTYYSIARNIFNGEEKFWTIIADINPPTDPDDLEIGRVIKLPSVVSIE